MKKRSTKLIALCAVLVLAVGAYVLMQNLVPQVADETEEETDQSVVVASLDSGDIQALHWKYLGEELTLERKSDGAWQYADDEAFPLDQSIPEGMLLEGATVTVSQRIDAPEDLAEYGLDEPSMSIALTDSEGNQTVYKLGSVNTLTGDYYMLLGDDTSTVYMAPESLRAAFAQSLYGMIQSEALPLIGEDVRKVAITRDGEAFTLEYVDENEGLAYTDYYHWFLTSEEPYRPVDAVKAQTLYEKLTSLEWVECVNYNASEEELETYGLADPVITVTLTHWTTETVATGETDEDGNALTEERQAERTFTLELGNYLGSYCYARLPGSAMVYTVDAAVADALLLASYESLQPDDICLLDWDTVTSIAIALDGKTYTLRYEGAETTQDEEGNETASHVYTHNGEPVDGASVRNLLSQITRLTASGSAPDAEGRGEVISFTFTRDRETDAVMKLTFHSYDSSDSLVEFAGEKRLLVSRTSVESIQSAAAALIAE